MISDAVKGEASAFGQLYDHYQPRIYRFVFIKVGRREEAEDLTHQVFLSAWQNIQSYKQLGFPFSSWLYQIARNQVIDHYRTRKPEVELAAAEFEYASALDHHETLVEHKMELEKVMHAIRGLKPLYQDILIMRFIEELSLKEVADALDKTQGAVKLLQHRALGQLRTALTESNGYARSS